jgi:hypothetical protein
MAWKLATGHELDFLLAARQAQPTAEEVRAAWVSMGDALLAQHLAGVEDLGDAGSVLAAERGPGTRPWGWWEFEAPEPRRQIADGPEPVEGAPLWFGVPQFYRGIPPEGMYETQADYLARLGIDD